MLHLGVCCAFLICLLYLVHLLFMSHLLFIYTISMSLCHWDRKTQMELRSIWGCLVALAFSCGCCDGISISIALVVPHFPVLQFPHFPVLQFPHVPVLQFPIFQFSSSPIFQFSSSLIFQSSSSPVLPFSNCPIHCSIALVHSINLDFCF